jgi:hypothetical protein
MAAVRSPDPVLLVAATCSRHADALQWGQQRLEETYGPVALSSPAYAFDQTAYYEPTMGRGLHKRLLAFGNLVPPDCLATVKLHTNELERQLADSGRFPEPRCLNLDPGILCLGKFLLATTKDQVHRIYLRDGIFAEVTLRFHAGGFEPWPWTYPDYQLPVVLSFLKEARDFYRRRLLEVRPHA